MDSHLYREFAGYYEENRCKSAPANPRRIFKLAERLYESHKERVSALDFIGILYEQLGSLFKVFSLDKYSGTLSAEDHFVNMLAMRLKTCLKRAAHPRTDKRRRGDRTQFLARPELGLWKDEELPLHEQWARETVRDAVRELPTTERDVIRGRYWQELTDREIGRRLGIDHKTVGKKHEKAIERIRKDIVG